MNIPGFLIADWVMVLMAIGAPLAFALRARRIALVLAIPPLSYWIIRPILFLVVEGWPWWAQGLTFAVVALLMLQGTLALIFGRGTAEQAVGQILASVFLLVFWAVQQMPRGLWVSFSAGRRAYLRRRASLNEGAESVTGTAAMKKPEVAAAGPHQQTLPTAPDHSLAEKMTTIDEDKIFVDKFHGILETGAQGVIPGENLSHSHAPREGKP